MTLKLNDLPLREKAGAPAGGLEPDPARLRTATPEAATVAALLTGRISVAEKSTWMRRLTADAERGGAALAALPFNAEIFSETGASLRAGLAARKVVAQTTTTPAKAVVAVVPPPPPPTAPPTATASGIDPAAMAGVSHPYAREAIAAEPDRGKAYEMIQKYSGDDGALLAGIDANAPSHGGGGSAVARVAAKHKEARRHADDAARKT